jgi:hypothetical protein
MAWSKVYDINYWIEDDQLKLVAYKLQVDSNGKLTADCSEEGQTGEVFTRNVKDKRSRSVIAHLLQVPNWDSIRSDWEGYDSWHTTELLTKPDTPKALQDWYDSLPPYAVTL